jgi:hypothetical protein
VRLRFDVLPDPERVRVARISPAFGDHPVERMSWLDWMTVIQHTWRRPTRNRAERSARSGRISAGGAAAPDTRLRWSSASTICAGCSSIRRGSPSASGFMYFDDGEVRVGLYARVPLARALQKVGAAKIVESVVVHRSIEPRARSIAPT